MAQIASNTLGTMIFAALVCGVPTCIHWIRGGKRFPISRSYRRMTLYYLMGFGMLSCAISTVLLGCVLYDRLWAAGSGSPLWAIPLALAIMAVSGGLAWCVRSWLNSGLDDFS